MKLFFITSVTLLQLCYGFVSLAQQVNIRTYSIENGLVNNDVPNIYHTPGANNKVVEMVMLVK